VTDINVEISDDPVSVSVSNAPGPSGASSFFKGIAAAWPPSATPTAGWIYTLPDPVPAGTPAGFLAGYGAQWDGSTWNNIGPVRGPAGPAGPQGAAGSAGSPGVAGTNGTAATIAVGSVTTGAAGTSASVVNAGTSSAAILNITIPRGDTGAAGSAGAAGSSGVISVTAPLTNSGTSSAAVLGITIGTGIVVEEDSLRADLPYIKTQLATVAASGAYADLSGKPAAYSLPTATASVLGGIKIGSGLTIDGSGVVTAAGTYTLPAATVSALGGVIVGTGLSVTSGTVSVSYGTTSTTACAGNDARLSDARTPTAHTQAWSTITATPTTLSGYGISDAATSTHTHGNLTNAGAIGSTSGQIVVTTTSGVLTTAATIAAAAVSGLAAVATSGAYADLSGKPTIPNITSGTAAPSGGSSGDIYLRYS